jgi:hypothetical protein
VITQPRSTDLTLGWHKKFGGLKVDQAKCLKGLESENSKLKRLVAELSLDRQRAALH